jgi:archaellum component FlaC
LQGLFEQQPVDRRQLQDLFAKFLKVRAEVENLESERIAEFETPAYEMENSSDPELVQAIKEEKKDMDRDLDLFDQCINTIKKLIVTQGADE